VVVPSQAERASFVGESVARATATSVVCPANQCQTSIDGITLREDYIHYEGPAAELVVRWVGPRLDQLATVGSSP